MASRHRLTVPVVAAAIVVVSGCATTEEPGATSPPDAPSPADASAAEETRARFADVLPGQPGCSVAVARNGEVVFAEAYGAAGFDPLRPLTPSDVVDIGSTSKQFTANALGLLAEAGEVGFDDPVSAYVPELGSWAESVSLGNLVHHTSGIPDYLWLLDDEGYELEDPAGAEEALAALSEVDELEFAPGDGWEYSNSNYFLVGQVVERVTGEPLGDVVARLLFEPAGMNAVMDYDTTIDAEVASFEPSPGGDGWDEVQGGWTQVGDGGIRTTPSDLVRWASQYWAPTIGGPDISTERMAAAAEMPGEDARYGWGIIEQQVEGIGRVLGHSGAWENYVTEFEVAPEQRTAVAVTCLQPDAPPDPTDTSGLSLLELWTQPD